ncbi:MAG: hypothetical protein KAH95_13690, partial [Spirochaetales bacterium]|nr:hypothetical protein [Spirochaetales bacterium]
RSKGSVHIPVLDEGMMVIKTDKGTRTENHPNHKNFHQPLIDNFVQSVMEDHQPVITGKMGMEISLLLDKIYGR